MLPTNGRSKVLIKTDGAIMITTYILITKGKQEFITAIDLPTKPSTGDYIIKDEVSYIVVNVIFDRDRKINYINVDYK